MYWRRRGWERRKRNSFGLWRCCWRFALNGCFRAWLGFSQCAIIPFDGFCNLWNGSCGNPICHAFIPYQGVVVYAQGGKFGRRVGTFRVKSIIDEVILFHIASHKLECTKMAEHFRAFYNVVYYVLSIHARTSPFWTCPPCFAAISTSFPPRAAGISLICP